MKTKLSIEGNRFLINGQPTYSELPACPAAYRGLLLNARFIQGVFDDRLSPCLLYTSRGGVTFAETCNDTGTKCARPDF